MAGKTRREQAMAALLNNNTVKAASEASGIPERTLYDIMSKEGFREELEERRRQIVEASCSALQARIGEASAVLMEIMGNPSTPPQARVTAAKSIIDFAMRSIGLLDILPRLEMLEEAEAKRRKLQ